MANQGFIKHIYSDSELVIPPFKGFCTHVRTFARRHTGRTRASAPESTFPGLLENVLKPQVELHVGLRGMRNVGRPDASGRGTIETSKFGRVVRKTRASPAKSEPVPVCVTYGAVYIQVSVSGRARPLAE